MPKPPKRPPKLAAARQQVEENLHRIHTERATHETDPRCHAHDAHHGAAKGLEEVQAQHKDLYAKCADLADTDSKLEKPARPLWRSMS